ncbi:hypothetical protein D3C85_1609800 [compost metagenome]
MSVGVYKGKSCPFAFTANDHWVLFYFRKPAVQSKQYSDVVLGDAFDTFKAVQDEEWTLKLRSIDDVRRLIPLLVMPL